MKRQQSHQAWLEYFKPLQTYEQKGLLEISPDKHEAYITRAALCTLCPTPPLPEGGGDVTGDVRYGKAVSGVARRIRAYAGWRQQDGPDYMAEPFALHVVAEDATHDLLCTVLLTQKRRWWRLWRKKEDFEVITYNRHEKQQ